MTFWNQAKIKPKRQYQFQLQGSGIENGVWIWAKTCDKPSHEINTNEYVLGNHKLNFPGVVTWRPVQITIVDIDKQTQKLYQNLEKLGYKNPEQGNEAISKNPAGAINKILIMQFDDKGSSPIEQWELKNAMITTVDYGSLEYASDELVTLTLTITYDYAVIT